MQIERAVILTLVFLGGFWSALIGVALWELRMGGHESIIPAAVTTMLPPERRPSAGIFTAGYGIFWFLGSALMGLLYDRSMTRAHGFWLVSEIAAIPLFIQVK